MESWQISGLFLPIDVENSARGAKTLDDAGDG
jgi:hypothetical protein